MRSYTKVARVAGLAAATAAIGLGFGAGTAAAKPVHVSTPHIVAVPHAATSQRIAMRRAMVTSHPLQTFIDRVIDSIYVKGENSPLDPFTDMLTPAEG